MKVYIFKTHSLHDVDVNRCQTASLVIAGVMIACVNGIVLATMLRSTYAERSVEYSCGENSHKLIR